MYNILKAHEDDVKEIPEDKDKTKFGGPFALLLKMNVKENSSKEKEENDEEWVIFTSNDEAMAYYSNNNVTKFYKNPMKGNFINNAYHKTYLKSSSWDQSKSGDSVEKLNSSNESFSNKKLVGDSRFYFNYCNVKNHLPRDCMLKKFAKKKEKVKEEAY